MIMQRRQFLKSLGKGVLASSFLSLPLTQCTANPRPNILFIMSDDHGFQAISAYNGKLNKTPNIDRLAKEGVLFEQSFVTNSICAPSRAVLLTGKYSHLNGVIDNSKVFDGKQQTFPKILQAHGYQTAMIGKWHLKSDPTGFDYWNILPGQGHYYNPDFIEMGQRKRLTGYVTDLITDIALDWLKNKRDKQKPFCLLLHHKAPHRNWMPNIKYLHKYDDVKIPVPDTFFDDYATRQAAKEQEMEIARHLFLDFDLKVPDWPGEKEENAWEKIGTRLWEGEWKRMTDEQRAAWQKAYKPKNEAFRKARLKGKDLALWKYQRYIKDYLRCIDSVDENVGKVLEYLDQAGLAENTLVIYTSDQGFYLGEHGWFDKRWIYEPSLRMPLLVRYPAEVPAGVRNKEDMVLNLDFAPTFLDFANVQIPADMQGQSFRPVLKGKTPNNWRKAVYYHYYEFPAWHMVKRHYGIRTRRYKLAHFYYDIDEWELFDLKKDPNELNNVFNDPAYASVVRELKRELQQLREFYGDTELDKYLPAQPKKVNHVAIGKSIRYLTKPSKRYDQNPQTLVDGRVFEDGTYSIIDLKKGWQGFEGKDAVIVIDLGRSMEINTIAAQFLQQIESWIFMPTSVLFLTSLDGRSFKKLIELPNSISEKSAESIVRTFRAGNLRINTRYIKMIARNRKSCPAWHAGAGEKAWIFIDEIEARNGS